MKAIVNQEECISCGMCIDICPNIFSYNLDNKSVAMDGDVPEEDISLVVESRDACPVTAINIIEESDELDDSEDQTDNYNDDYADKIDDLDVLDGDFSEEDS